VIFGAVVGLQARVPVAFRLPDQSEEVVECVVDTGFEGQLALPPDRVAALGLSRRGRILANLADDSDVPTAVFRGVIVWADNDLAVEVLAMGRRPLIGTELLAGFNLSADFEEGGELIITPL
jgi:clan AA aspartic protease